MKEEFAANGLAESTLQKLGQLWDSKMNAAIADAQANGVAPRRIAGGASSSSRAGAKKSSTTKRKPSQAAAVAVAQVKQERLESSLSVTSPPLGKRSRRRTAISSVQALTAAYDKEGPSVLGEPDDVSESSEESEEFDAGDDTDESSDEDEDMEDLNDDDEDDEDDELIQAAKAQSRTLRRGRPPAQASADPVQAPAPVPVPLPVPVPVPMPTSTDTTGAGGEGGEGGIQLEIKGLDDILNGKQMDGGDGNGDDDDDEEEEELLGSDLDDDDDLDAEEAAAGQNLVLCQWTKVHHTNVKWKANLTHGIIHFRGAEAVFKSATADWTWK